MSLVHDISYFSCKYFVRKNVFSQIMFIIDTEQILLQLLLSVKLYPNKVVS